MGAAELRSAVGGVGVAAIEGVGEEEDAGGVGSRRGTEGSYTPRRLRHALVL